MPNLIDIYLRVNKLVEKYVIHVLLGSVRVLPGRISRRTACQVWYVEGRKMLMYPSISALYCYIQFNFSYLFVLLDRKSVV